MLGFDRGVMEWFCVEVGVVWRICCTGLGMRMVGCTYFEDGWVVGVGWVGVGLGFILLIRGLKMLRTWKGGCVTVRAREKRMSYCKGEE